MCVNVYIYVWMCVCVCVCVYIHVFMCVCGAITQGHSCLLWGQTTTSQLENIYMYVYVYGCECVYMCGCACARESVRLCMYVCGCYHHLVTLWRILRANNNFTRRVYMHIYIYIYVCVSGYLYVYVCVWERVCSCIYLCGGRHRSDALAYSKCKNDFTGWVNIYTHMYSCVGISVWVCIHMWMCVCVYVCTLMYVCGCRHLSMTPLPTLRAKSNFTCRVYVHMYIFVVVSGCVYMCACFFHLRIYVSGNRGHRV